MKRKDVDEVNEGFFDVTLCSPALKIRRLDAELAPIIDERGTSNPEVLAQSMPFQDNFMEQSMESSPVAVVESAPVNEERAIVLFNPKNSMPSLNSRLPFSFSADSEFLSRFKNPVIWANKSGTPKPVADDTQQQDDNSGGSYGCLAVVPWAPNVHIPSDMMDSDAMDVEDDYNTQQMQQQQQYATSVNQGWNQWQQHCMVQQPPNNLSTPITWLGQPYRHPHPSPSSFRSLSPAGRDG